MICLKNRTFAVSQTTLNLRYFFHKTLWFAWKIVLLQYRKQPYSRPLSRCSSCDLLEKSYFCSIANNQKHATYNPTRLWFAWKIVLLQYRKQQNFQRVLRPSCCDLLEKSYFCSIANNTTDWTSEPRCVVICLKNRTFAVSQTTLKSRPTSRLSCDLLEKSYFCSIANNRHVNANRHNPVVICLKNRTFAVSQTT